MTAKEIKAKVQEFKDRLDTFREEVRVFVTDKSLPVAQRWEVFTESGIGNNESYIQRFNTLRQYSRTRRKHYYDSLADDLIDGDRYSRHEVIYVEEIIDRLEELMADREEFYKEQADAKAAHPPEEGEFEPEDYDPQYGINLEEYPHEDNDERYFDKDSLNDLKEEILDKMMASFTFDW